MQTVFLFTECRILTPIFACVRGYLMENDHATAAVPGGCRYSDRSALEALEPLRVVAHDYADSTPQAKVWPPLPGCFQWDQPVIPLSVSVDITPRPSR